MKNQPSHEPACMFDAPHAGPAGLRHLLPLIILGVVIVLELVTKGVRMTPTLLMIGLAAMAPLLSPRHILFWSAVFFALVVASLIFIYNGGQPDLPAVIVLRSVAFLVVAVLAFRISRARFRLEQQARALHQLFDILPAPIVVSDSDGNITFANRACGDLLGMSLAQMKHSTFSSLFTHPLHRGRAIEQYLARFEPGEPGTARMQLAVQRPDGPIDCDATSLLLDVNGAKLLVTQLNPKEPEQLLGRRP